MASAGERGIMNRDSAEIHEVPPATNNSGHPEADAAGDRIGHSDLGDEEIIDPDAVIIDEAPPASDRAPDRDLADSSRASAGSGVPVSPTGGRRDAATGDLPGDLLSDAADYMAADTAGGVAAADDAPADAGTGMAGDANLLREQWTAIQSGFVDDPRASVVAAADLVTEAIATFVARAEERERGLRGKWDRDSVDTEGLRHALRSYRAFLDRLVAL